MGSRSLRRDPGEAPRNSAERPFPDAGLPRPYDTSPCQTKRILRANWRTPRFMSDRISTRATYRGTTRSPNTPKRSPLQTSCRGRSGRGLHNGIPYLERFPHYPVVIRVDSMAWRVVPFDPGWTWTYLSMMGLVGLAWLFLPTARGSLALCGLYSRHGNVGLVDLSFFPHGKRTAKPSLLSMDLPNACADRSTDKRIPLSTLLRSQSLQEQPFQLGIGC